MFYVDQKNKKQCNLILFLSLNNVKLKIIEISQLAVELN